MPANLNLATAFIQLSMKGASALISGMNSIRKNVASSLAPLKDNFQEVQNAALGFVAAASPQAINTFVGSNRLLAATIGTSLVPQIIQVSKWIQQAAAYIRTMDDETKHQIASWVGYTAAIMAGVYAFTKLNSVFSLIVANPVAATFLAVAAAILKINDATDKMVSKMEDAVAVMERMKKGKYSEEEYKGSIAAHIEKSEYAGSDAVRLAVAEKAKAENDAKVKQISRHYTGQNALENTRDWIKGEGVGGSDQAEVEQRLKESAMLGDLISRLKSKKGGPKFTDPAELAKGGKNDLALAGAGVGGGGGSTTSLENAFMQNAQASLAADELQQKILQAQLEGNLATQKIAANTERAAAAAERNQHP